MCWTHELVASRELDPRWGEVVHQPDLFTGEPLLGKTHVTRTRRCQTEGLCQVCAVALPRERWLADLRIRPGDAVRGLRGNLPVIVDAWTCDDCMPYSLENCPALLRRRAAGSLQLLRVSAFALIPTPERPRYIMSVPFGPVGYVKIVPTVWDWVEPEELLEVAA